jgi:hypothetical protein
MSQHKEQQGYLTIAANTADTDYLRLAYLQALNIKATQRINQCAVIVDSATAKQILPCHNEVFDYVIEAPDSTTGPYGLEPLAFRLTPFKETIKLESDLLFTGPIDHWWQTFRLRDVVLSTGCKNYLQQPATSRRYRQVFDDNALPDVYNGLMYFRFSRTAADFFKHAEQVFSNWSLICDTLKNCRDPAPTTDVAYAIAATLTGADRCTIPSADFINFVHMKPAINGYNEGLSFQDVFVTEFDDGIIRINNVNQYHPIHYHDKTFATDELIKYYERRRRIS